MTGSGILAGRKRHPTPTPEEARVALARAQGDLVRAYDVVNAAIHERARTCAEARDAGLGWVEIGDFLGGMREHSALELAQRYRAAVKAGHTLKMKLGGTK